ncbi:MAG: TfoX protein [Bacteroidetes bacterium]|nr:TfoX protein [Bacteroidota bacterium]
MENDLTKFQNIGKETARKLNEAGIDSYETLVHLGTEQAFRKLKSKYPNICINLLYSLEGAIEGIKWNQIPKERKLELTEFFRNNS